MFTLLYRLRKFRSYLAKVISPLSTTIKVKYPINHSGRRQLRRGTIMNWLVIINKFLMLLTLPRLEDCEHDGVLNIFRQSLKRSAMWYYFVIFTASIILLFLYHIPHDCLVYKFLNHRKHGHFCDEQIV